MKAECMQGLKTCSEQRAGHNLSLNTDLES
jgi:hypothetical protein